jgi:hypothetical protein
MKARSIIALVLFVGGLAVVLYGLGSALMELFGLYSGAINAPLDNPPGGEKGVSDRMIRGVIIGAIGVGPMIVGSAMLGMGMVSRVIKIINRRAGGK